MAEKPSTEGASEKSEGEDKSDYRFYDEPLKRLMQAIDEGVCPWNNPCLSLSIAKAKSGLTYRGFNQFYLAVTTMMDGHRSPYWMTLHQANEFGGHVKKGERSSTIVYRKVFDSRKPVNRDGGEKSEPAPANADGEKVRRYTRIFYYRVFNYDQTEGCDIRREPFPTERRVVTPDEAETNARAIVAGFKEGPVIVHTKSIVERGAGHYTEKTDTISLRPPADYPNAGEYWSTLFHELIHATGAEKRLDFQRGKPRPRFGDREYALEELTAEIGANLLLVRSGLENQELRNNSAAYLRHWKAKISDSPKMLIWAADRAARAVNLVLGITPETAPVVATSAQPEADPSAAAPLPTVAEMVSAVAQPSHAPPAELEAALPG